MILEFDFITSVHGRRTIGHSKWKWDVLISLYIDSIFL